MIFYIIKRLFTIIPTLLVVITISFFLMKMAPGDPFAGERVASEEVRQNLLKFYGLDKSLLEQYLSYMLNILQGDFGPSLKIKDFSVGELISMSAPISLSLGLSAMIIAVVFGVLLGFLAAINQNTRLDYTVTSFSMVGIVIPNYAIAPILTLFFGVYLPIFPVSGWYGFSYYILPVLALSLPYIAYIARITRGSVLDVLSTNFIRTAYSKGLSDRVILFKHAFKPAILPVVSYLGPALAGIITGSSVIEVIFDVPGLGRYFVQGALNRDYTLVMGIVIFYSFLVLIMNLIVDILYVLLDPKVSVNK